LVNEDWAGVYRAFYTYTLTKCKLFFKYTVLPYAGYGLKPFAGGRSFTVHGFDPQT
jgi:hypothetical protein